MQTVAIEFLRDDNDFLKRGGGGGALRKLPASSANAAQMVASRAVSKTLSYILDTQTSLYAPERLKDLQFMEVLWLNGGWTVKIKVIAESGEISTGEVRGTTNI